MTVTTQIVSSRRRLVNTPAKRTLGSLGLLAVLLLVWQFVPGWTNTPEYVVPPLSDVLAALFDPTAFPATSRTPPRR